MKKSIETVDLSVLNLAQYPTDKDIRYAFETTLDLAQHAEKWGYKRYWMAEHHNLEGIASAATAVLIGYVAQGTKSIRVGSGGIMLPNHSPYIVAEQFGTLEVLYPGRIDLGLGRAPGSDQATMRAIRGPHGYTGQEFPELVKELLSYFKKAEPGQRLKAIPGAGLNVPIWILGSSMFSAQMAAYMGQPYAFAGHFAPAMMKDAVMLYREEFRPSEYLSEPRVMVGVPVVAAETDEKAEYLSSSVFQAFLGLIRGNLKQIQPPVSSMDAVWSMAEKHAVMSMVGNIVVGGPEKIKKGLSSLIEYTGADELIITSDLYLHEDRLKSYEIISKVKSL